MNTVTDEEIDALMTEYAEKHTICTHNLDAVRYQAREEIAIKRFLDRQGAKAFTKTFEDLYGMEQQPDLASQRLTEQSYGYGGEGSW